MKTRKQIKKKISKIETELLHLGLVGFAYSDLWQKKVKERIEWKEKLNEKRNK